MIVEYRINQTSPLFSLDTELLASDFRRFTTMNHAEFLRALPDAIHFACLVSWWKGFGQDAVSDVGIVHQLVHLLTIPGEPMIDLVEIRDQFKRELFLE